MYECIERVSMRKHMSCVCPFIDRRKSPCALIRLISGAKKSNFFSHKLFRAPCKAPKRIPGALQGAPKVLFMWLFRPLIDSSYFSSQASWTGIDKEAPSGALQGTR